MYKNRIWLRVTEVPICTIDLKFAPVHVYILMAFIKTDKRVGVVEDKVVNFYGLIQKSWWDSGAGNLHWCPWHCPENQSVLVSLEFDSEFASFNAFATAKIPFVKLMLLLDWLLLHGGAKQTKKKTKILLFCGNKIFKQK